MDSIAPVLFILTILGFIVALFVIGKGSARQGVFRLFGLDNKPPDPMMAELQARAMEELAEEAEHRKKVQKAKRAKELRDLGYEEGNEEKPRF